VGDRRTLDATAAYLFFVDDLPDDNSGRSTVQVLRGETLVGTYVVDGRSNVLGAPLAQLKVPLTRPGYYSVTLKASDFTESRPQQPQRHVMVLGGSGLGDYRVFSLNGIGASKTLFFDMPEIWLFFVDDIAGDNTGGSTVQVSAVPDLDIQVASVAIRWSSEQDQMYQLEYATALAPDQWAALGSPVQGTGGLMTVADEVLGQPKRFYRVRLLP
jgi:hypothetical protein